jgi:hypothetical protein
MVFSFKNVALRVNRVITVSATLYRRVRLVFDFFAKLIDRVTQKPLFNEDAKEMAELVLEAILRGEISDALEVSFYCHKTNDDGTYMVDKYGLPLYRSFRVTNLAEALHQAMISSMGHTKSGPRYKYNLLIFVRHMYNWGASERNRPDFSQLGHFIGDLVDSVNGMYQHIFGEMKYANWWPSDELFFDVPPQVGIVPLQPGAGQV